ncbi:hypothetical protein RD792_004174 [Penstemon davidsonii]|uniref:Cyclin N-terminal domain-containing protein n=1 Tax=Penstemon davidsonii TaxID=160366 RepID=A0ABR0DHU8_9LAMI|nr:hypothetical protein RD792_004174 [Penstemon davidsonii]
MFSHFQEQVSSSLLQNPTLDALYCEEERFDDDLVCGYALKVPEIEDFNEINKKPSTFLFEHDLLWEDDEIVTLLSKERKQTHLSYDEIGSDGSLKMMRNEGVKWILKVISHYGYNAITAVLAVNYYDRFITSLCFQKDKPWMSQLAAVACLSIAAKVEETQVPLLLDFQVEEAKYVFEAKTIQRMEILVLSTLEWRMNPVTPMSFFDHIVRRFELISNPHCEFLKRCESIILSIITDCRLLHYLPSVIACATMVYVIQENEPCYTTLEYKNQLMNVLRTNKEEIDDCYKLVVEVIEDKRRKLFHKRKYESIPNSPSGVIDAYFSSDSSNDSWAVMSSVTSSPEPFFKRSKA